jgi:hypothetical protein
LVSCEVSLPETDFARLLLRERAEQRGGEGRGAEQRGGEVREVSNREQQREEGGLLGSFSILLLSELETRFELFSAISVSLGILEEAIMNRAAAL